MLIMIGKYIRNDLLINETEEFKLRTLVISDIHGCHNEFNKLLQLINYNPPEDKLILLGDYCDRGLKSKDVIEQVKSLVEEWNVIAVRGNHDQMFKDAFEKDEDQIWLQNGGFQTIESYVGLNWFDNGFNVEKYYAAKNFIKKHYQHHIDFIKKLPVYHEDDNHIFVHAGIDPFIKNWKEQSTDNFLWIRDLFLKNKPEVDKTVIFGHTPTITIQETENVYYGEGKIGIDGGCCFGYQLNCLEVSEEGYREYFVKKKE